MRDLLLTAIVFGSIPFILQRPWIGVMMWVWLGIMNPHRLTWGFAFSLPFALAIALATFAGIVFSKERFKFPFCGVTVTLLVLCVWMSVTTLFAIHPEMAIPQWEKVMKIQLMNLIALYILSTRFHIEAMAWITTLSMAFFGIKGGIFTILGGGADRVYGPSGSFIEENNQLALATLMAIPMLCYLAQRAGRQWVKWGLLAAAVLCGFSVLGSHSRGALLGGAAMIAFLWLKNKHKVVSLAALVVLVPFMIAFMPQHWTERMESIENYDEDASAQGRINAWMMAINLTKDRPLVGGGFDLYSPYTFGIWAPNPTAIHSSHSNYFQMLGEHGYPGLLLFLLLLFLTWRMASGLIARTKGNPDFGWVGDMCRMIQVSLVAWSAAGAFVNLAYFDLPYFLITLVVLSKFLVDRELVPAAANRAPSRAGGRVQPRIPPASRGGVVQK